MSECLVVCRLTRDECWKIGVVIGSKFMIGFLSNNGSEKSFRGGKERKKPESQMMRFRLNWSLSE